MAHEAEVPTEELLLDVRTPAELALSLDGARLASAPVPIVRRVLLKALRVLAGEREVSLEHVMTVAEVLAGSCGGASVPGGRVELRAGNLVLSSRD